MKAVLISIQPKWVAKIANGKKTIEVRKTAPKCEVPFKCYIYCTKPKKPKKYTLHTYINSGYGRKEFGVIGQWRSGKEVVDVNYHLPAYRYNAYLAEGKVIGEFVCDNVIEFESAFHDDNTTEELRRVWYDEDDGERDAELFAEDGDPNYLCTAACLTWYELKNYVGTGYHTFYGWHISDFKIYDKPRELSEFRKPCKINLPMCDRCEYYSTWNGRCENITRPPQSWQYVEE